MSSALDMSLDDLIKNNKKPGSGSFRGARGRGGPVRRFPSRAGHRPGPYTPAVQAPDTPWQHDMFSTQAAMVGIVAQQGRAPAIETGTKLYISNLDYGVSNEDVKELFSEVGDLKRYSIHYDRSGRSKGTAEVVFSRRADAVAAVKRYNNVQLDGKLMKIEIVGTNIVTAPPVLPVVAFPNPNVASRGGGRMGNFRGGFSGVGGRGRKRGGGSGDASGEKISAADLDAELDKYHSEAVDIEPEV